MKEIAVAKVMIVDDDRTTTRLLQMLLELDGFEVVVVARGGDVLPMAQETQPELIMIDYHLTDMHGVEAIAQLRQTADFAHIPIIMASGMDVSDEAKAAGATEFLVKPLEPDKLPILFNRLLGHA
jgi:PleD family two-component response regulator